ncbi:hypothetical protein QTP88_006203 [Uroleucon formosanum]
MVKGTRNFGMGCSCPQCPYTRTVTELNMPFKNTNVTNLIQSNINCKDLKNEFAIFYGQPSARVGQLYICELTHIIAIKKESSVLQSNEIPFSVNKVHQAHMMKGNNRQEVTWQNVSWIINCNNIGNVEEFNLKLDFNDQFLNPKLIPAVEVFIVTIDEPHEIICTYSSHIKVSKTKAAIDNIRTTLNTWYRKTLIESMTNIEKCMKNKTNIFELHETTLQDIDRVLVLQHTLSNLPLKTEEDLSIIEEKLIDIELKETMGQQPTKPRQRWSDRVRDDLKLLGIIEEEQLAKNRESISSTLDEKSKSVSRILFASLDQLECENVNPICEKEDVTYNEKSLGLNFDDSENDFNKNRRQLQLDLHSNQNYDVDFITPDCKECIGTKKAFLERHPIQPIGSNGKQIPFNPSKLYYRALPNGEKILKKWISYSSILNKIFCANCMMFSNDSPFVNGYTIKTKHVYKAAEEHENSKTHQQAISAALQCAMSKDICSLIDRDLTFKRLKEIEQRRLDLKRLIDIIIFIGRQGSPFRGKEEGAHSLNKKGNHGNFLELVLLLADYDSVLRVHLNQCILKSDKNKQNRGRGSLITFMSKSIVNKLIIIIGNSFQNIILNETKESSIISVIGRQYSRRSGYGSIGYNCSIYY